MPDPKADSRPLHDDGWWLPAWNPDRHDNLCPYRLSEDDLREAVATAINRDHGARIIASVAEWWLDYSEITRAGVRFAWGKLKESENA
ncbi:hypothetical protein EV659_1202 [Rhodothalassium salexigens DSM 2132]|uniref:Uncharacterized protein n=1 Tax=Rhodothalassium salexigens DSM 2132 TaxID=1188247 RepID=A0A4R2P4C5_RHOSA|nr:hypothetical protein [Rhodothalassium salexigens]MBB4212830.1 hypothetical protein [Rhodothalassium salexigens DSM 2132]MBK1640230.1 hypothetical protein [Rhodothalassium salexigens DSM 2132]TCP29497.1 hypothetical protein EV659_1202 [Rhodothalassium salexigens DSM 2132]